MSLLLYIAAFVVSFVTMFFGIISGGVGLVQRPVLLLLGVPPATVIGTARVSGVIGELPGLYVFQKNQKIDWKLVWFLSIPVCIGSLLASYLVVTLMSGWLDIAVGVLLFVAGILLLINPQFGVMEKSASNAKWKHVVVFFAAIAIAFIGVFTGGMGPLFFSLYIWAYGKTYTTASALGRTASYIGGAASFIVFALSGVVDWVLCAVLAVGMAIGAYFGAHYGLRKGEKWVRTVVLIVVFATAVKLLFF